MTEKIQLPSFFDRIFSIGVSSKRDEEFNERLKILNIFTWTCMIFCAPYYTLMFIQGNYVIGLLFVLVQAAFSLSIWLNKFEYYILSKILILITTNYSVLILNFTFGYDAGFYLYYFTSPLIVYSFFNFRQFRQTFAGLILYISSYFIADFADARNIEPWLKLEPEMVSLLYNINVVLAFTFLIVLASSFSKFHFDASQKITRKNTELEQNKKELEQLLKEKNTLLSETHHRVKNNLAVISGMFDLQMMHEKDPTIKSVYTISKNRIKSMSLIHESLYSQSSLSNIDFKKYIESLIKEIQNSLQTNPVVKVYIDVDNVFLDLSKAIPCGLIINEVITNSFKHAFKEINHPEIRVKMTFINRYILTISDNGLGYDSNFMNKKDSLGMSLIEALTNQLNGTYSFKNEEGTVFNLTFGEEED